MNLFSAIRPGSPPRANVPAGTTNVPVRIWVQPWVVRGELGCRPELRLSGATLLPTPPTNAPGCRCIDWLEELTAAAPRYWVEDWNKHIPKKSQSGSFQRLRDVTAHGHGEEDV